MASGHGNFGPPGRLGRVPSQYHCRSYCTTQDQTITREALSHSMYMYICIYITYDLGHTKLTRYFLFRLNPVYYSKGDKIKYMYMKVNSNLEG